MQCISFLGQLKEMVQGQSCGRDINLNAHRSLYGHIIVMAQNCSWIDILSHSLGLLSSALSTADWLFQNTKECTPVSAITTLSEAFGIEGSTISISWSWILKQWREFNKGSAMAFLVDEWVTPDVGNRRQGKSYMPLCITNATELLPRIALSVNVSFPIWRSRSRRTDIPSCPCWQIWLQGCDQLFRWHRYFCNVTHVSIQDLCSFNQTIWN